MPAVGVGSINGGGTDLDAAQSIEYVIAALSGLLAAQTFLVGLMAVRLDASYDSAVARIARTARRIGRQENEQLSVSDVLEEARDVVVSVRDEVSARATLAAVAGVVVLSAVVACLGSGVDGVAVPFDRLTIDWSKWRAGETCVLILLLAITGLAALAVYRSRKAGRRLRDALDRRGLAAAAAASGAVEAIASGEGDAYAADRARLALTELDVAFPGWAGTAELRGDFWAAAATQPAARDLAGVTVGEALRRARADYASALALLPVPSVDVLIRDADAALSQADQLAHGTRARWLLQLEALGRAEEALGMARDSAPAALMYEAVVTALLGEPRRWGAFGVRPAEVPSILRERLESALEGALAKDAVDFDVLNAWARNRVATVQATVTQGRGRDEAMATALENPAARLVGHLVDVVGRMRAAPSNVAVLGEVHAAVPVLLAAQEVLRAVPAQADRQRLAGVWLHFTDEVVEEADLLPIARRGDLTQPEVVFARALLAYRRLSVDDDAVRALTTLTTMPVRHPVGRLMRVRRATAGAIETFRVWLDG